MAEESSSLSSSTDQNSTQPQDSQPNPARGTDAPNASIIAPTQPVDPQSADRNELVSRARAFLRAPQIQSQDIFAKRRFLIEKGLDEPEIELLLRELPPQLPAVPPRTYPQLPQSGLPTLLLGIARLTSWFVGGSALLLFVYYRFFMPRIIRTSRARHSLKTHQISLLQKLSTSLRSLKEDQSRTFASLPSPVPYKESSEFSACHTLDQVLKQAESQKLVSQDLPQITLLRCGIEEFKHRSGQDDSAGPSTEELFRVLENKIPWLVSDEGFAFEQKLWDTLSSCDIFESSSLPGSESPDTLTPHWSYKSRVPPPPPPLMTSLGTLSSEISQCRRTTSYHHTLQSLSEFTGYISTQVYAPYKPPASVGSNPSNSTVEDELKKEIRALKGMVLNRRSFLPAIPRVGSSGHS
ncbi:hypothetical protein V5O48_001952 [Marasmius crinis-equi]|uniref:Peroxisome membrane anchor protein Pex14p N-terminal domain-containing protein n=1 Tax=Marasmius crinis-equi TaxID=585013 RepID=A0ABR3FY96_9AGAR